MRATARCACRVGADRAASKHLGNSRNRGKAGPPRMSSWQPVANDSVRLATGEQQVPAERQLGTCVGLIAVQLSLLVRAALLRLRALEASLAFGVDVLQAHLTAGDQAAVLGAADLDLPELLGPALLDRDRDDLQPAAAVGTQKVRGV